MESEPRIDDREIFPAARIRTAAPFVWLEGGAFRGRAGLRAPVRRIL
jgi:hypothetical protein